MTFIKKQNVSPTPASVRGAALTNAAWSGDISLHEVVNGRRAVWERLMSDYI